MAREVEPPPLEYAAAAAHATYCRLHGYEPIPWSRLRQRDRARWVEIAEASNATMTLARAGMAAPIE